MSDLNSEEEKKATALARSQELDRFLNLMEQFINQIRDSVLREEMHAARYRISIMNVE